MIKVQGYKPVRKVPTMEEMDQQVRKAAQQMEGKFLEEMVRQMRATVPESGGFIPTSNAEKIFREQLDQQYVSQWGDKGGIGLADMIYNQLMEKYGPQMGLRPQEVRPQGPIQVKPNKEALPVFKSPSGPSSFLFDLNQMALESQEIKAPWSGKVTSLQALENDQYLMNLEHENGFDSKMVFKGLPEANFRGASVGKPVEIQAGQRLGVLSPEAKTFFWTVDVHESV